MDEAAPPFDLGPVLAQPFQDFLDLLPPFLVYGLLEGEAVRQRVL